MKKGDGEKRRNVYKLVGEFIVVLLKYEGEV